MIFHNLKLERQIESLVCVQDALKMFSEELIINGIHNDYLQTVLEYILNHRNTYSSSRPKDTLKIQDKQLLFQMFRKKEELLFLNEDHSKELLYDFIIYGYWGYRNVIDVGNILSLSPEAQISDELLNAILGNDFAGFYTPKIMAYLKILETECKSILPLIRRIQTELSEHRLQELLAFAIIHKGEGFVQMTRLFEGSFSEDGFFKKLVKEVEATYRKVARKSKEISLFADDAFDVLSKAIILRMHAENLLGDLPVRRICTEYSSDLILYNIWKYPQYNSFTLGLDANNINDSHTNTAILLFQDELGEDWAKFMMKCHELGITPPTRSPVTLIDMLKLSKVAKKNPDVYNWDKKDILGLLGSDYNLLSYF